MVQKIFFGLMLVLFGGLAILGVPEKGAELLPPVVAFAAIFILRKAVFALLLGGLVGAFLLSAADPQGAVRVYLETGIFGALSGSWHVGAILFTLILGAFAAVLEASGGLDSLIKRFLKTGKDGGRKRFQITAGGFGFVCFFDGLANSLLVGRVLAPAADRAGVSRVKLAYIADSTGSALACIVFISTWIAAQLSYINEAMQAVGLEGGPSGYSLFFSSIPYNFYCLFTLILVFVVAGSGWNPGPMGRFEAEAERLGKERMQPGGASEERSGAAVWRAVVPLLVLSLSIPICFYLWEPKDIFPVTVDKLRDSFGGAAGPYALTAGAIMALGAALICYPREKGRRSAFEAMERGAAAFLHPLLILVLAWAFGNMLKHLGTASLMAEVLSGGVGYASFPLVIFLVSAVTSFVTGSSWGTMGLMMPLAIPILFGLGGMEGSEVAALEYLPATIAAVFGGAVFGDHCSPFSDTTIVSSIACGVEPGDHVKTQMPYALFAASVAILPGYLGISLGLPVGVILISGLIILVVLPIYLSRRSKSAVEG
ncbi:MAG: Na+/H+ antiporter NhaC family protein [Puniceicoccaceae bacterium]